MARFESALDSVRRAGESDFQRCLKAVVGRGQTPLQLLGSNATANARIQSDARQRTYDAREQYKHFRGQAYRSIRPIAQRIAGQPIRLAMVSNKGRGKAPGSKAFDCGAPRWVKGLSLKAGEELRLVDSHPVLAALSNPAPEIQFFSDWLLKYVTVASLEITGSSYLWARPVGPSREIWPLPSHWVRAKHGAKLFEGWSLLPDGYEDEIPLARDEIVPFAVPDPGDPLRPLGPLEANAREVMVEEFVVEAQKRSFQLGIHPSALIKVSKGEDLQGRQRSTRLREYQREQVIQAINRHYRGMLRYGDPMVLDGRIESIEPYGNKPSEMDFGSNAGTARERVEQSFGTSAYVVGASGLGSRAESAEADAHFCYSTVNPKIELISRLLTTVLLRLFDKSNRYVLFIEPCRPRDDEMQFNEWTLAMKSGAATLNEFRTQILRLKPVPWGDSLIVPNGWSIVPANQLQDGYALDRSQGAITTRVDPSAPKTKPPADGGDPR